MGLDLLLGVGVLLLGGLARLYGAMVETSELSSLISLKNEDKIPFILRS